MIRRVWRRGKYWLLGLLALWIGLVCAVGPVLAQETNSADVVLDGRSLFEVTSSGNIGAIERADSINLQLEESAASGELPRIRVEERNNLPTILLNGRHLLTVTQQDAAPNDPTQQAQVWSKKVETAVTRAQWERTPEYLRDTLPMAIAVLVFTCAVHLALGRFWKRTLRPKLKIVTHIPDPDSETDLQSGSSLDLLLGLLLIVLRSALWLGSLFYLTNLFPWSRRGSYHFTDIVINSFTAPLFRLGDSAYSVTDLLVLAGLLFGLLLLTRSLTNLLKTRLLRLTVANRGAREAIAVIIQYTLLFIGTLVLLQAWGLDLSSLAILASALGIGVGLGLQDIAKDIGSGLVLVFERPIQVGDFVQVGEFQGTIERIGSRSTLVRTLDHISIIVPNSKFLASEVINWSHDNPLSRLHVPVGVAYGSDIELVRSALLEATQGYSRVLTTPQPQVFFKGFGDSTLDFDLLVWTAEPSKHLLVKSDLYFRIEAQLRQRNVEIPFPQRDLNLRSEGLPIEIPSEVQAMLRHWLQKQNGAASASERDRS